MPGVSENTSTQKPIKNDRKITFEELVFIGNLMIKYINRKATAAENSTNRLKMTACNKTITTNITENCKKVFDIILMCKFTKNSRHSHHLPPKKIPPPQKPEPKSLKNPKRFASKTRNKTPQKPETACISQILFVTLRHQNSLKMKYLQRIADNELRKRLSYMGAVLIEGPKWCGKTTTAEQQAKSVIKLQDPDMAEAYLATAQLRPSNLLMGATPRLIDEWQDAPRIWDAVRSMVDERGGEPGQFILTGSNAVNEENIRHSGTGRISRMKMYPMSLYESRESNGRISLMELFDNPMLEIDGVMSDMDVNDLIRAACRGGWPAALRLANSAEGYRIARDYVDGVAESDVTRIDGVRRDPTLTRSIIRSYARNLSTLAKKTNILKDVVAMTGGCSDRTFDDYVAALTKLFVIQDINAWSPAVRSATVIRRSPKRGLVDPSIAAAALGLSPQFLEMDLKTFGFIFECMAIRDLRAYSQAFSGEISYYHDRYDLEVDAVLHLEDGRYALIEFKLGSDEIELGAKHLLEVRDLVRKYNAKETQLKLREPDLLIIITGGKIAYRRPDNVLIIPLATLKN